MLSNAAGSVDVGTLLGQAVGGGITGAIVTAVVGLIKNKKFNVRFGSLADICCAKRHVRFTSKSRHARCKKECPLSANSGLREMTHFEMPDRDCLDGEMVWAA